MKTFTINGKEYEQKEITFGMIRRMAKLGFNLLSEEDMSDETKLGDGALAYFSFCADKGIAYAENEIDESGDIVAMYNAFAEAIQESPFVQRVMDKADPENTKAPRKKSATKV